MFTLEAIFTSSSLQSKMAADYLVYNSCGNNAKFNKKVLIKTFHFKNGFIDGIHFTKAIAMYT